ncbi:MAG: hypothetical protein HYV63_29615 [Candidatus Schekmanbacteria bacterium]|nr:hypothetical protein [Candidatus Schekmanbacteria bacterium]
MNPSFRPPSDRPVAGLLAAFAPTVAFLAVFWAWNTPAAAPLRFCYGLITATLRGATSLLSGGTVSEWWIAGWNGPVVLTWGGSRLLIAGSGFAAFMLVGALALRSSRTLRSPVARFVVQLVGLICAGAVMLDIRAHRFGGAEISISDPAWGRSDLALLAGATGMPEWVLAAIALTVFVALAWVSSPRAHSLSRRSPAPRVIWGVGS